MTVPQQLPNFSTYVVPGVYWESTPTPVSALANVTNSVVALVGPGIGYETNTDTVTLSDLTITGVSSASAAIITTSAAHGFVTGQSVVVAGVDGGRTYRHLRHLGRQSGSRYCGRSRFNYRPECDYRRSRGR